MISSRVLDELLERPLGPYRDQDVLHETACQTKGPTKLVLYSFILEHDGHVIGLDESESPVDGQDDRVFRFRGVLKIAHPGWLSDSGLKIVETELNLRARERAMREGERPPVQLTLEELFRKELLTQSQDAHWRKEDETRLTVRIQGERKLPALFMQPSLAPNGLVWTSKDHTRKYIVATIDVLTYSLSENFFWRWKLFDLMEKICREYPYIPSSKRTPIWFVEKYLEKFACPPEDKHRRLIFDENDSDVDETGRTVTPRYLLKPHTSEILGLFAAHAEWLITNNVVKSKKLFDSASWKQFVKRVRKERRDAAKVGVRWGLPVGEEVAESSEERSFEEDQEESDTGLVNRLVKGAPVIGKTEKVLNRKTEIALTKERVAKDFSSDSGSEGDPQALVVYGSDFTEPSDPEEEDSEYEDREEQPMHRIPWELQQPPSLPDVDGRWSCPLDRREGCTYRIDLHNLTEEQRSIPEIEHILQKKWRNAAYDDKVIQGFSRMVTEHYLKHFEEQGVKLEKKSDGKPRFTFINGKPQRRGSREPIRGPMPPRGTLPGESRVIPIVHTSQARHFR